MFWEEVYEKHVLPHTSSWTGVRLNQIYTGNPGLGLKLCSNPPVHRGSDQQPARGTGSAPAIPRQDSKCLRKDQASSDKFPFGLRSEVSAFLKNKPKPHASSLLSNFARRIPALARCTLKPTTCGNGPDGEKTKHDKPETLCLGTHKTT